MNYFVKINNKYGHIELINLDKVNMIVHSTYSDMYTIHYDNGTTYEINKYDYEKIRNYIKKCK